MKKQIQMIAIILVMALSLAGLRIPAGAQQPVRVTVDGQELAFDQPPMIENDRVLVPVRAIFEALGAQVDWEASSRTVTARRGQETVTLQIGSRLLYHNREAVWLDTAPRIVSDRTLVPVRAVSESFGAQVSWYEAQRLVQITSQQTGDSPSSPDGTVSDYAKKVFELVNAERANHGIAPLAWSDDLAAVAYAHSKDMNDRRFMSHNNPDGQTPFDRMKAYGLRYSRAAENIAAGQKTPQAVMQGWMNSSGHRANILNPELKMLGVGYYQGDGPYGSYWTQCFMSQ